MRPKLAHLLAPLALATAMGAGGCLVVDGRPSWYVPGYYDPCDADWECPGGTACFTVATDFDGIYASAALCTRGCTYDLACPAGGTCSELTTTAVCVQRCGGDEDCPIGLSCVEGSDHVAACVPW